MVSGRDAEPPILDSEKLIAWGVTSGPTGSVGLEYDLDTEEMLESRVYNFNPAQRTVGILAGLLEGETRSSRDEAFIGAIDLTREMVLKILAKRGKDDGRVSFVAFVSLFGKRIGVGAGDKVDEAVYRQTVAGLETKLLNTGLVGQPLVTTQEEWQRDIAEARSRLGYQ